MDTSQDRAHRIAGIEVCRFLSALAILIVHYDNFFNVTVLGSKFERTALPFYSSLAPVYEHGALAVEVFWILSGFIFFLKYWRGIGSGEVTFKQFSILRLSRLYPLHLLTLVVVAILGHLYVAFHGTYFIYGHNDLKHFLLQLLFASHWGLQDGYSFNAPVWSVSIEIIIYALFFVFAKLTTASPARLAVGLACILLTSYLSLSHRLFDHEAIRGVFYFFVGGLAAVAYPRIQSLSGWKIHGVFVVGVLIVVSWASGHIPLTPVRAVTFLTPILCILLAQVGNHFSPKMNDLMTLLGSITYSSYMIHVPIQLTLVNVLDRLALGRELFLSPTMFLIYILGVLAVSLITYRSFELPAQQFLRARLLQTKSRR